VDGEIIDLNRIPLPADTPIIDERLPKSLELCVILHPTQLALGDDADRIWRQRHQEYIDRIAKETIKETAQNLNVHENMVVRGGMHPYDPIPQLEFFACLADRRLARLYSHLESLPKKEADQFCRKLFNEQLQRQKADFTGIIQAWKMGKPPTFPTQFPIGENWHALNAIVFLSATYSPPDETLRQIDAWSTMLKTFVLDFDFATVSDNPETQSALRSEFRQFAEPQPLFLFTLYAHMLRDREALTNDELAKICPVREMTQDLAHQSHLARWNSIPRSTAPGRPGVYDREDVIKTYTPFRSWCSVQDSEKKQRAAVANLRARLTSLKKSDP